MGDQVKIQMKTTVFITRRGKSFAIAKVISLAARFSTDKSFQESKTRKLASNQEEYG